MHTCDNLITVIFPRTLSTVWRTHWLIKNNSHSLWFSTQGPGAWNQSCWVSSTLGLGDSLQIHIDLCSHFPVGSWLSQQWLSDSLLLHSVIITYQYSHSRHPPVLGEHWLGAGTVLWGQPIYISSSRHGHNLFSNFAFSNLCQKLKITFHYPLDPDKNPPSKKLHSLDSCISMWSWLLFGQQDEGKRNLSYFSVGLVAFIPPFHIFLPEE